jgi:hypothetical protein
VPVTFLGFCSELMTSTWSAMPWICTSWEKGECSLSFRGDGGSIGVSVACKTQHEPFVHLCRASCLRLMTQQRACMHATGQVHDHKANREQKVPTCMGTMMRSGIMRASTLNSRLMEKCVNLQHRSAVSVAHCHACDTTRREIHIAHGVYACQFRCSLDGGVLGHIVAQLVELVAQA